MIAVANLLNHPQSPGNHFAFDAYVEGDFELGLITNRHGSRLLALPHTLLSAIQASLDYEVGDASRLVLFQCGQWWGKNFYRRFNEEVSQYYGTPLAQLEMVEFLQCLKECWKTYGWGLLEMDMGYYNQGFLVAITRNSSFAATRPSADVLSETPVCYTEAGFLSAFFSQLTGQELHCVQTACESMGAEANHFVLGKLERVKPAEAWLDEKHDHQTIMERLCHGQALPEPVRPRATPAIATGPDCAPNPTVSEPLMNSSEGESPPELVDAPLTEAVAPDSVDAAEPAPSTLGAAVEAVETQPDDAAALPVNALMTALDSLDASPSETMPLDALMGTGLELDAMTAATTVPESLAQDEPMPVSDDAMAVTPEPEPMPSAPIPPMEGDAVTLDQGEHP